MKNKEDLDIGIEKLITFVLIILSFLVCLFHIIDHDELEAIHTAWKIMRGQVMYIDFFQQKPPFFHYALIPVINIFSESVNTIYLCRLYVYLYYLVIVGSTFFMSKYVFGNQSKYISVILLLSCTFFTDKLTEVRPDVAYMMFGMLAILLIFRKLKVDNLSLLLSGIFFGLSFSYLPKAVIYIIPVSMFLFVRAYFKKVSIIGLLLYFFAMFAVIGIFWIHLSGIISLEDYYFFNYSMNFKFLGTFSPWPGLILFFKENSAFLLIALYGLFFLKKYRQKEVAILAIILFLSIFKINVPNRQYILPSVPFLAMIAANFISRAKFLNHRWWLILIIIMYPFSVLVNSIINSPQSYQIQQIKYVLEHTRPIDKVYDGNIEFNVFRDDIHYFWFSVRPQGVIDTYNTMRTKNYDVYKEIEYNKPQFIYMKYLDSENEVIKKYYVPSKMYKHLYVRRSGRG